MSAIKSSSHNEITLASASPRRAELLDQIQVTYKILPVNIDESPLPDESAEQFITRLAIEKAQTGFQNMPGQPALGSDTVVVIGDKILGKPDNQQHAKEMLELLSGNIHQVMTAVAICNEKELHCLVSKSEVEFEEINDQQILAYWETGEPVDKAGSYGIQGIAAQFIKNIKGSYSGIMGLPLYETTKLLKRVGIIKLTN